jgi:hypothetical protein
MAGEPSVIPETSVSLHLHNFSHRCQWQTVDICLNQYQIENIHSSPHFSQGFGIFGQSGKAVCLIVRKSIAVAMV